MKKLCKKNVKKKNKLTNSWECRSLSCRSSKTGTVSRWQRPVTGLDLRFRGPFKFTSLFYIYMKKERGLYTHRDIYTQWFCISKLSAIKHSNFEPMNRKLSRVLSSLQGVCMYDAKLRSFLQAKHLLT